MAEFTKSLKGQLLLDNGRLQGSFFHRTVLLICQHDADGAFGLVLNRSIGAKVGDALVADLSAQLKQQALYLGGPVQPQALSYLQTEWLIRPLRCAPIAASAADRRCDKAAAAVRAAVVPAILRIAERREMEVFITC